MNIILIIMAGVILAGLTLILTTSTRLSVSFRDNRLKISLAVAGCGVRYDSEINRVAVFCGPWSHPIKTSRPTADKKETRTEPEPEKQEPPKRRRKIPVFIIMKIIKADVLFVGRILSRVKCDKGQLELQPVIADPALAGMAFGLGQALGGVFPGLRETIRLAPSYGTGSGRFAGTVVFSIKNRQLVYVGWRLLRDLPIIEIVRYYFSEKR